MKKNLVKLLLIVILFLGVNLTSVYAAKTVSATPTPEAQVVETTENIASAEEQNTNNGMGLIAVALATGLACIGAGIAVATVGASAVGAISENPKLLGKTIIFAGLAEGIAIYRIDYFYYDT